MKILSLLLIVILILHFSDCDRYCKRTNETNNSQKTEFEVTSVDRQFIITFKGWYTETARREFITAALKALGYNYEHVFSVLPRDNPMAGYPSDFDLILFSDNDVVSRGVGLLLDHPLVRSKVEQDVIFKYFDDMNIIRFRI